MGLAKAICDQESEKKMGNLRSWAVVKVSEGSAGHAGRTPTEVCDEGRCRVNHT